ncbi:MAG: hypothetical protein QOD01_1467 [Actinomycetota bacterium]|nr:hypothetical protein [Actinomycetota bacterium]
MDGNSAGCGVLVSMQVPGYEFNLMKGHRATGFLADIDLVCVPDLPQALLSEASTYEVLLVPVPGSGDQQAERHKISSVEAVGLEGATEVAAFFRLVLPSKLFAARATTFFEQGEFAAALEIKKGDLWALAGDLGLGNPPYRADPSEILQGIPEFLAEIAAPRSTVKYLPTLEKVAISVCCIWDDGCC